MLSEADKLLADLGRVQRRTNRLKTMFKQQIEAIDIRRKSILDRYGSTEARLKESLTLIHASIREAGGSKTYELPSGTLKCQERTDLYYPEDEKEEEALIAWLREKRPDLVRVKHEIDKVAFAKAVVVAKTGTVRVAVGEDGESVVVPNVTGRLGVPKYSAKPDADVVGEIDLDDTEQQEEPQA